MDRLLYIIQNISQVVAALFFIIFAIQYGSSVVIHAKIRNNLLLEVIYSKTIDELTKRMLRSLLITLISLAVSLIIKYS